MVLLVRRRSDQAEVHKVINDNIKNIFQKKTFSKYSIALLKKKKNKKIIVLKIVDTRIAETVKVSGFNFLTLTTCHTYIQKLT